MSPDALKPKARWRPRFQFSLRMLLLAVTAAGVWLGWNLHRARQQRDAVRAIQAYGGSVVYDFEYDDAKFRIANAMPATPKWLLDIAGVDSFHSVWGVNLFQNDKSVTNSNENTDILIRLEVLPEIKSLLLHGRQATDESLQQVAKLRSLEQLCLFTRLTGNSKPSRPAVTDAGIGELAALANLRMLDIDDAPLTDKSLETIGRLSKLERLVLQGQACAFTDVGLKKLSRLSELKELIFQNQRGSIAFTDEGLASLAGLSNLETVWYLTGEITDQGLIDLASLPKLKAVQINSNAVSAAGQAEFARLAPRATCGVNKRMTFVEELQALISRIGKLNSASITPDSVIRELPIDDVQRQKLMTVFKKVYFPLDLDTFESFAQKIEANPDITVGQMAELVKGMVGR